MITIIGIIVIVPNRAPPRWQIPPPIRKGSYTSEQLDISLSKLLPYQLFCKDTWNGKACWKTNNDRRNAENRSFIRGLMEYPCSIRTRWRMLVKAPPILNLSGIIIVSKSIAVITITKQTKLARKRVNQILINAESIKEEKIVFL